MMLMRMYGRFVRATVPGQSHGLRDVRAWRSGDTPPAHFSNLSMSNDRRLLVQAMSDSPTWFLIGPHGAITWRCGDLGRHSTEDIAYGSYFPDCAYHEGGPCHYDGSTLAADELNELLERSGEEAVWEVMGRWYEDMVEDALAFKVDAAVDDAVDKPIADEPSCAQCDSSGES